MSIRDRHLALQRGRTLVVNVDDGDVFVQVKVDEGSGDVVVVVQNFAETDKAVSIPDGAIPATHNVALPAQIRIPALSSVFVAGDE